MVAISLFQAVPEHGGCDSFFVLLFYASMCLDLGSPHTLEKLKTTGTSGSLHVGIPTCTGNCSHVMMVMQCSQASWPNLCRPRHTDRHSAFEFGAL